MSQHSKIKISFIIPCYNCAETLKDTISSIINLKFDEFEICMVDDGSKDNTYKLLQFYSKKYPERIKIGKNQENKGGGYTRNECVKLAKYDWYFLIDSDNYLDTRSFYRLLSSVTEDDNLVTFQKINFFYNFMCLDFVYKTWSFLKDKMDFNDLRRTSYHPVVDGNYLFRKSVFEKIGGYDTEFGALDTWSFGYKALVNGYEFKIVSNSKYYHRVDGKSYWTREVKNNNNNLKKLLLKYSYKFSSNEISNLQGAKDVQKCFITLSNDFVIEKINSFYKILLKIYYIIYNK